MKIAVICLILAITIACSSGDGSSGSISTKDTITVSRLWLGNWERDIWQNQSTLEVKQIQGDSILFSLLANSGGHLGEIEEGRAIVKGDSAIYMSGDGYDSCHLIFKLLNDSILTIHQGHGFCDAGMGVTFEGTYKSARYPSKEKPKVTLKTLGIFQTENQDSVFKALVGDDYDQFLVTTQLGHDEEDLDGFNATIRASGVRGLYTSMENIIMIDALNNIWAAVIDGENLYYFTNKPEYKKRLPKTIDNWRQRFRDYPVVFK